jgi:hypothetical protein
MTEAKASVLVLAFKPMRTGTSLRGFASVRFGSGLEMYDVAIHVRGSRQWSSPPARPFTRDGAVIADEVTGKAKWQPLIGFSSHAVRASWSRQILKAVRAAHPEAFAESAVRNGEEDERDRAHDHALPVSASLPAYTPRTRARRARPRSRDQPVPPLRDDPLPF